jgi:ERCC4-type nuclease
VTVNRATLETGDFALAGAPDGSIIERKTVTDFLAAVGRERQRFDRELLRARYCGAFAIVVEGNLCDVLRQSRGVHPASIMGTIAAWTRRGFPVVFAGTPATSADFALRYLTQPLAEAERRLKACSQTKK